MPDSNAPDSTSPPSPVPDRAEPADPSGPAVSAPDEGPPPQTWMRWAPLAIAGIAPALLFLVLPPLTRSGLWDPYELNVADLSRRIALNIFGAANLALDGADNSLPHLNDLGRPQAPFTAIALGFKLFGLT